MPLSTKHPFLLGNLPCPTSGNNQYERHLAGVPNDEETWQRKSAAVPGGGFPLV
jgi:hypothetical protein